MWMDHDRGMGECTMPKTENASALEKVVLILEEGLKEIRNSVLVQSPNWIACRVDSILKKARKM
jgi:hypothetical protein